MKITPSLIPLTDAQEAAAARRKPAASATSGPAARVALSPTSTALAQADSDVDMARVEAIRQAIRSGELQIDASRIADGLINSVRELLR